MSTITPIKLTKAKREELIDELGDLKKLVDAHKKIAERYELVRGTLAALYESEPANKAFIEEGQRYTLEISEKANKRTITRMLKLFRLLGQKLFLSLCSFPLAAVDTNVPWPRHKEFLEEEQIGPRKLKAVEKLAVVKEAA